MYLPNENRTEFIFYVYAYLRVDGTPYYIGKGKGNRSYKKGAEEIHVPDELSRIIMLEQHLSTVGALALERRYIEWYGRKDLGTGILRNRTPGGDGGPGSKKGCAGRKQTDETKAKLRAINLGKKHTEETKTLCGLAASYARSDETKAKISAARKGIVFSEQHKENLSKANKGKPKPPKII